VPQIDVRDLAAAHVVGMTHPKAAGERFLMVHETYTFPEFMRELAPVMRPLGYHVTTRTMGYNVARLATGIEPRLKFTVSEEHRI
jgi:nucleoside-diphosphate-sugar epimerase